VSIVGSAGFDGSAPPTRYERRLRELTSSARVPVRFIPFTGRTELPELLREADILVVPSTWKEPSALTVGEGLATGLVVIGSDVGGIPEVLGEAGLLVRVGDPRALAQALDAVMSSDEELARLKASARAHALDHDWEQSWQALSQICRDILVA
jgi:glycosyltransferase involved in cell wall biosynthesis